MRIFYGVENGLRVSRHRHCICVVVNAIVDRWMISSQFLKELNYFGGLLITENSQL